MHYLETIFIYEPTVNLYVFKRLDNKTTYRISLFKITHLTVYVFQTPVNSDHKQINI